MIIYNDFWENNQEKNKWEVLNLIMHTVGDCYSHILELNATIRWLNEMQWNNRTLR